MTVDALAHALGTGDRRALARAITLVESGRDDDQEEAARLLELVLPTTGRAVRVGISGPPGVGKSTLIEALGCMLVDRGEQVAVLAIDPTSPTTGGSLLGDKTRMERLQASERAFIRPSPSSGMLGGTAPHSRDALLLCEAAGFTVVLVETVGVGQSEIAIADLVDTVVLVLPPGGGDELQGQKRGLLERTDVIAVNKADGAHKLEARSAARDLAGAIRLIYPRETLWRPPVLTMSAREGSGLTELWNAVCDHRRVLTEAGEFAARRRTQQVDWMWAMVRDEVIERVLTAPRVRAIRAGVEQQVRDGTLTPALGADQILTAVGDRPPG